jgi:hypothetical protein
MRRSSITSFLYQPQAAWISPCPAPESAPSTAEFRLIRQRHTNRDHRRAQIVTIGNPKPSPSRTIREDERRTLTVHRWRTGAQPAPLEAEVPAPFLHTSFPRRRFAAASVTRSKPDCRHRRVQIDVDHKNTATRKTSVADSIESLSPTPQPA